MNIKGQNLLFQKLCDNYKIKFHDVDIDREYFGGDVELGFYDNTSACTFEDIFLGRYDDLELRLISFFHELGHIDDIQKKRLGDWKSWSYYHFNEASAWKTGLELADELGFTFSESAIKYGEEQLKSYFQINPPNNEKSDIKFYGEAKKYAFISYYREKSLNELHIS